jgi:hypothetical protein
LFYAPIGRVAIYSIGADALTGLAFAYVDEVADFA